MFYKDVNKKVKQLKKLILDSLESVIEPSVWKEFLESEGKNGYYKSYAVYDHDLSSIRDLKVCLNMLVAIERATDSYSLWAVSVFKTFELPRDLYDFYCNYSIYMSTSGTISHYLAYAKEMAFTAFVPAMITKLKELSQLFTKDNLEKGASFLVDQLFALDSFHQKYLQEKKGKKILLEKVPEIKQELAEDLFSPYIKKIEEYLKKLYADRFDSYFSRQDAELYVEHVHDDDTVKNIKHFLNGIISVRSILNNYNDYQKSNWLGTAPALVTLISSICNAYAYFFKKFDCKVLLAEQYIPIAGYAKECLKGLNLLLENLTCVADRVESDIPLRSGTLLNRVNLLVQQHNMTMRELSVPVDCVKQKRNYHKARIEAREKYLSAISCQYNDLSYILLYKNDALSDVPTFRIESYINKFEDDICVKRDTLTTYKKYLAQAEKSEPSFFRKYLEKIGNYMGLTVHSEMMAAFKKQLLSLDNQRKMLSAQLENLKSECASSPYDYFNQSEFKDDNQDSLILQALKQREQELLNEKNALYESKTVPVNHDEEKKVEAVKLNHRDKRCLELAVLEHGIFSRISNDAKENHLNVPAILQEHNTCLSTKSAQLLDEIDQIQKKRVASI